MGGSGNGNGTLKITNGGAVTSGYSYIGNTSAGSGTLAVDGAGSTWTNGGTLIGVTSGSGNGTLDISGGAAVDAASISIYGLSVLAIDVGRGSSLVVGGDEDDEQLRHRATRGRGGRSGGQRVLPNLGGHMERQRDVSAGGRDVECDEPPVHRFGHADRRGGHAGGDQFEPTAAGAGHRRGHWRRGRGELSSGGDSHPDYFHGISSGRPAPYVAGGPLAVRRLRYERLDLFDGRLCLRQPGLSLICRNRQRRRILPGRPGGLELQRQRVVGVFGQRSDVRRHVRQFHGGQPGQFRTRRERPSCPATRTATAMWTSTT